MGFPHPMTTERELKGIAAAEGIAVAPAFFYQPPDLTPSNEPAGDPAAEMARFASARETAKVELAALKEALEGRADAETAAIFEAHAMILDDPTLETTVEQLVEAGQNVEAATAAATEQIAAVFGAMEDESSTSPPAPPTCVTWAAACCASCSAWPTPRWGASASPASSPLTT